ncbi:hypothetical protein TDB9533_04294 [Thalassocella blandensis]|nr:hypothetical protein TDB9533_04294 [Thalassocella blandensis]
MIIESIDRAGHVIEVFQHKEHQLSVGRGYGNDIILHDPHIDAEHVKIKFDLLQACFYVRDMSSSNGTQVIRGGKAELLESGKYIKLNAGDAIVVGKTRLRLMHPFVAVPAAVPLSRFESIYTFLSNWVFFVAALVVVILLYTFDQYLNAPYNDKLSKELITGVFLSFIAAGYGFIWLAVAKIQRTEIHFFLHANLALMLVATAFLFDFIEPVLRYNMEWLLLGGYLSSVFNAGLMFVVVAISAAQFNRIRVWVRYAIALILPAIVLLNTISDLIDQPEFQTAPSYLAKIVSPPYQWAPGISETAFLQEADEVFE